MTGLEALRKFKGNNNTTLVGRAMGKQHYLDCLQVMEKSLKALEIIKEKRVDLCILTDCDNVNEYNKSLGNFRPVEDRLTYDEFNLLKEVLK